MYKVEIFSQGEEVISGQVVDSNAAWLSQQLANYGFTITRHTAVGDDLHNMVELMQEISKRADICLCTGGLGPTVDDLTVQAVAQAFQLQLQYNEIAYQQMQRYFQQRNRDMPESNRKQAMLPDTAIRLDNAWGTAPGFILNQQPCRFIFMPGVPLEMRHMFHDAVLPWLQQNFSLLAPRTTVLRSIGIGESLIQQKLQAIDFPKDVQLGFCAGVEDVQTKLQFQEAIPIAEQQVLAEKVATCIGDQVYSIDNNIRDTVTLADVVNELLQEKQQTVAVIETISHGQLLAKCRSHDFLTEALFAQTPEAVCSKMQIPYNADDLLQTAIALAENWRQKTASDIVLLQFYQAPKALIANKDKSIKVLTLLNSNGQYINKTYTIGGHLARKQNQAALLALDLLRKFLQKKTI